MNTLLNENIIFTDKTLSYEGINDLFNAADLYFSPYFAEGFNLTSLEALSAGLPVAIPQTGSTKEYIRDIYNNGGEEHVLYIPSKVVEDERGFKQNNIDFKDLLDVFLENETKIRDLQKRRSHEGISSYNGMKAFINENYSWNKVAELMFSYFQYICSN